MLTIIDYLICIVEIDAVIRIRKSMKVVILDAGEVEFIE